jgi:hypothetical protein
MVPGALMALRQGPKGTIFDSSGCRWATVPLDPIGLSSEAEAKDGSPRPDGENRMAATSTAAAPTPTRI